MATVDESPGSPWRPLTRTRDAGKIARALGDRVGSLVVVELAVGGTGVVVDKRVHPLVSRFASLPGGAHVAVAGDPGLLKRTKCLLSILQQIAGTGPFVQARLFA